jgi:hypothetical protein
VVGDVVGWQGEAQIDAPADLSHRAREERH